MSLKSASVIANTNVNTANTTPVSNPSTTAAQPASPSQPSMAATEPKATQPAAPVETTASTPEKAAYVWDPVAARDRINAAAESGTITLTPNADGTAYEVSGDTKKVRAFLKGLNARWNSETTNWTLPALALTDPTAASAQRDAIVAERQAKRAERAAAAPAKPATKKGDPKKTATKAEIEKADAAAKQPSLKGAKRTYDIVEVQRLIAAAVKTALGMVAATANNEKAIAALTAKILTDPRNAVGLTA